MIIDSHIHLNRYEDENKPALPDRLDALKLEMKQNRIDFAFALTSYRDVPGRPSVQETVEATKDISNIFVIAGMSYNNRDKWDLGRLREYLTEKKVRGLKFYCGYEPFYPFAHEMKPAIDLALEFDVPVFVHTGDTFSDKGRLKYAHPLHIDEFAVDHPELKIVICHLGNPWLKDTMEVVYKNKNVYTDMSGLVLGAFSDRFEKMMAKQIQEVIVFGMNPKKILYGTDWPISNMASYLEFVDALGCTPADKKLILGENALKLFNLDPKLSPYYK